MEQLGAIHVGEDVSKYYNVGNSVYRYKPSGEIRSASIYTTDGNFGVDYDANGTCTEIKDRNDGYNTVYKRK